MKKYNHCGRCGKEIKEQYNPYNVTFEHHLLKDDDKKYCLACATNFVKKSNQCKGGKWVIEV